jgi:hypothetical protein
MSESGKIILREGSTVMDDATNIDVALSFAGEDRTIARTFAEMLSADKYSVFFDEFERAALWGEDLTVKLQDVYGRQARFCVMFISEHYETKPWTKFERQTAISRMLREQGAYVLPIKLDDTVLPGLPDTIGYIDLRTVPLGEVFDLLRKKLGPPGFLAKAAAVTVDRIREVLAACYRRAIFARLHAQISWEAMFESLAQCRISLQKVAVYVEPAELQQLVAGIIAELDFIERRRSQLDKGPWEPVKNEINGAKLRIISSLLKLKDAAGVSFELPGSLTEDAFFKKEDADGAPRGPVTKDSA